LEEQKKKQEQKAKFAKVFEEKLKAINDKKMECGCFSWGSILQDLKTDDEKCKEV